MSILKSTELQETGNRIYKELKARIRAQGLLEKQPGFVLYKMIFNFVLFAASIYVLFAFDSVWVQLLNAAFMAVIFGQFGFIAHDVGHRQAFRSTRANNILGLIHGNLLLGMSLGWWMDKHNQHHASPNQQDMDPDIAIPVIAFSEEDALKKRGILKFMVRHQSILFFPILLFEAYSLRTGSIGYLLTAKKWKYRLPGALLMAAHFILYFGLIFTALGGWLGLLFILVQQALFGFYLASVFAPNHKGMLIVPKNVRMDFLRLQVLTARNVRAHPITDFWYGGLNYQIEHHLFPSMARNKLHQAQRIIRDFCKEHSISYHETSMVRSYLEILEYLHRVSASLRVRAEA